MDIRESIRLAESLAEAEHRLKYFVDNQVDCPSIIKEIKETVADRLEKVNKDINATLLLPQARFAVYYKHIIEEGLSSCFLGKLDSELLLLKAKENEDIDDGMSDILDTDLLDFAIFSDNDCLAKFREIVDDGDKKRIISAIAHLVQNAKIDLQNKIGKFQYNLSVLEDHTNLPS